MKLGVLDRMILTIGYVILALFAVIIIIPLAYVLVAS